MINWKILENPIFQTKPIDFFQFVKQNNMDPRKSSSSEPKCRPPRSRTHDHCVILGTFASSASALGVRSSALGVRSLILVGEQPCYWGHGSREWGHGKQQWGQMNSNDPTSEFSDDPWVLLGTQLVRSQSFIQETGVKWRIESSILPGQRNTETYGDFKLQEVVPCCSPSRPSHIWGRCPKLVATFGTFQPGSEPRLSAEGPSAKFRRWVAWPGAKLLGTVWQFQVFVICNRASPIAWSFSGLILSLNELQETSSVHDIEYTRCWT